MRDFELGAGVVMMGHAGAADEGVIGGEDTREVLLA